MTLEPSLGSTVLHRADASFRFRAKSFVDTDENVYDGYYKDDKVPPPVRIPGRMPGACVLHAFVPVFPCRVQPL